MEKKSIRQSNYELMRIVCIVLIVFMHTFGQKGAAGIFFSVIGNIGVTGFVLLSGYFGIKRNIGKLVKMEMMIVFYSVVSYVGVNVLLLHDYGMKELLSSFIPIISHKYWFLSCYFFLCILSPYINEAVEKFDKKTFRNLLLTMIVLFLIIPTVFFFDVMQDGGKGLVNMTLAYLTGRYISRYKEDFQISTKKAMLLLTAVCAVNFTLNYILTCMGGSTLYYSRDNSIFIFVQAVLVLILFGRMKLCSRAVNYVASSVIAVYILESPVVNVIRYVYDYEKYAGSGYYAAVVAGVVIVIAVFSIVADKIRKLLFGRLEDGVAQWKIFQRIK